MPTLFTHARNATTIADPGSVIEDGYLGGRFDTPCPLPSGSREFDAALEDNGTMPVAGAGVLGLATSQLVLVISALVVVVVGVLLVSAGTVSGTGVGIVMVLLGVAIAAITWSSARARRRRLLALARAWQNGWLRFAPARIGAVRQDRLVTHGRANRQGSNQANHYWYRAVVEVHPTDGTGVFTVDSAPFEALADHGGVPRGLRTAPNPVDALEPEYSNGWTVVRYVAGEPEASATVTTNLSEPQITAALRVAGVQ